MDLSLQPIYDCAIIGGDKRQAYVAEILAEKGYDVIVYALENDRTPTGCKQAENLSHAIKQAKNIILPIPMMSKNNNIFNNTEYADLLLETVTENIDGKHRFFGGCLPVELVSFLDEKKITYFDFMEDEGLALFNSIATAEGVISEVIMRSPINLHNSECLIVGYGKCGKTLSDKLKAISAKTTVCDSNIQRKNLADTSGHKTDNIANLSKYIGEFDFIFNTAPSTVIDNKLLESMKPSVMIFDIASSPGGVDYKKAKELGIAANILTGIPGKYAPKSSATALADFITSKVHVEKVAQQKA